MPATVVGLVAQFLIHPYLNKILELYNNKDLKGLNKIILKLIVIILIFGVVASICAYLLGPEVLGLIYGIDLSIYRINLLLIIIASTLYTIGVIYSSVLITVRDTFSQFIIYLIITVFAYIVAKILTQNQGINGATYAYLATMALQSFIYIVYSNIKLRIIFKPKNI